MNFEVKQGEVLGIIGRNGAGKSTLLKILSRITEPTNGRVILSGRVASLLEVGTGFHPELTGRENVFLNGAVLGMTQEEIRSKFDEIVAFAGVEKFLDTPVKYYSSGMYVRLAFAVAAHLEPEILVVDEVLAVGDADFQKKCLGKMSEVSQRDGRTVLFVSHNMNAVLQLTSQSVVLSHGSVKFVGNSAEAVEKYIIGPRNDNVVEYDVRNTPRRYEGTGAARIISLRFGRGFAHFKFTEPISYIMRIRAERPLKCLRASMTIFSQDGSPVGSAFSPEISGLEAAETRDVVVTFPNPRLAPGSYFFGVSIGSGNNHGANVDYDVVLDTLFFEVMPEETESGTAAMWHRSWGPIIFPELTIAYLQGSHA